MTDFNRGWYDALAEHGQTREIPKMKPGQVGRDSYEAGWNAYVTQEILATAKVQAETAAA